MFPPTPVAKPLASSISPISVVVVLLPFEPVIPHSFASRNCAARSTSGMSFACCKVGTPGLAITASKPS